MNNDWIPVKHRLPEKNGKYLITKKNGYFENSIIVADFALDLHKVDEYAFQKGYYAKRPGFYNYDGEYGYGCYENVLAWMPLPDVYKEEK